MFKNFHPVFQFIIIAALTGAFFFTAIHFHVAFIAAALMLIECAALGASITTHEENTLKYNLEDTEIDLLENIEARLVGEEKKVVAKIRAWRS